MNTTLWRLFDLRRDQDDADSIDGAIRDGARPVGTNLWVLFFAILIASVGLNVNSTAVIIGAMLISPLMGPIVAIGYGTAVRDLALIRLAAKTLVVFTLLSLATSTAYFALSPLDSPGSELLARTSPTLWDVLIAAFGGAAGMVAATRRSLSNIVPGVAIATALMPPLCTVGFGIAHSRWDMAAGAGYLFLINGVFIAAATGALSQVLRLPLRGDLDPAARRRHRAVIAAGIALVMAPSIWLGARFAHDEFLRSGALRVVQQVQADARWSVVAHRVDPAGRSLRFTTVGGPDDGALPETPRSLLAREGLDDAKVELHRAGDAPLDLGRLRTELRADVDRALVQRIQANEARLRSLEEALRRSAERPATAVADVDAEARVLFPQLRALTLATGERFVASGAEPATAVIVDGARALAAAERERLRRWLAMRLGKPDVELLERVEPRRRRS